MTFVLHGREYELVLASEPGGMALELHLIGAREGPIARVVYADSDGTMTFAAYERDVPFELIELLVSNARTALTPVT